MDIIQKISKTVCLLFLAILSACSENTLYIEGNGNNGGGDDNAATVETEVKGYFTLGGKKYESVASVETFIQSATPQKSDFTTNVLCSAVPQIIAGENGNGDITFLYRGKPKGETSIEVNEYTTATALLTLHPAFWCLSSDEYGNLETTMKSLDGYESLVSEVRKVLECDKSPLDSNNKDLIAAMSTCYKQFCNIYSDNSKASALSKMKSDSGNYDYYPIEFSPEAITMAIREVGLAPVYKCDQIVDGEVKASKLILPNTAYGLSDLGKFIVNGFKIHDFAESYRDVNRGDWVEFDMSSPTDYNFKLDRNAEVARKAQGFFVATDVLNFIGIAASVISDDYDAKLFSDFFTQEQLITIADAVDIAKLLSDRNNDVDGKWVESLYYTTLNIIQRNLSESNSNLLKNVKFMKVLSGYFNIYDGTAAIFSFMGRGRFEKTMPETIEQCFTQHNNVITTCNGTGISVRSGNRQVSEPGKELKEPIVFSVICNLGQRVKIEVVKGNGTLSHYYLTPKVFDGTTQYVSTEWTLGDDTPEQMLKAYIVDYATDIKQSPECVVTAYASKGNLLTSIGNAYQFKYDDKGRMSSIIDRTCMLADPHPEEIVTTRFEYKNDDGNELSRIISTGDGETDIWYNIKYDNAGHIQSFHWSGTDEYGTDYGSGTFIYEPDGRISRIISHADDGTSSLTFTWNDGLLQQMSYYEPGGESEEVNEGYNISYSDQKNIHEQYPFGITILDLGYLFFSGQIGPGPSHLPSSISGSNMNMRLSYTLRDDGYIVNEHVRFGSGTRYNFDFNYLYKDAPKKSSTQRSASPMRNLPAKEMMKRKHLRMFGTRR